MRANVYFGMCVCVRVETFKANRIAIHFSRQFGYIESGWACSNSNNNNSTFIALLTLAYKSHKQIHQNEIHCVLSLCLYVLLLASFPTFPDFFPFDQLLSIRFYILKCRVECSQIEHTILFVHTTEKEKNDKKTEFRVV